MAEDSLEYRNFIFVKVARITEDRAILTTSDGQQIPWPLDKMPDGLGEGDNVRLVLFSAVDAAGERKKISKEILHNILQGGN